MRQMLSEAPTPYKMPAQRWQTRCTETDAELLTNASRTLGAMLDAAPNQSDDDDFTSVWIGMLIGAGVVTSYEHASVWASFVRYNTDLVS